jgi:hypothetical protein
MIHRFSRQWLLDRFVGPRDPEAQCSSAGKERQVYDGLHQCALPDHAIFWRQVR